MAFFERQLDDARKKVLSDGERLAKHRLTKAEFDEYRRSVETLDLLHVKREQAFVAIQMENSPYLFMRTEVERRAVALNRARRFHARMMLGLTLIAAVFLVLVLPAEQVPRWAKSFSMMAAGAVMAGWFPLT
jgi:hypothetical protein